MLQKIRLPVLLTLLFGTGYFAIATAADEEAMAQAAERAGRYSQALVLYAVLLKQTQLNSPEERRLLERAAAITPKSRPLPPLPAEAERHFVRGQALVEGAKDTQDFLRAAAEFQAALRDAPWLADAHFNIAVVLDKANRFEEAMRSLKLYISASADEKSVREAQRMIYRLEVRQEEAGRKRAQDEERLRQEAAAKSRLTDLSGRWMRRREAGWVSGVSYGYDLTMSGNKIRIYWAEYGGRSTQTFRGKHWFDGTIDGANLAGTYSIDWTQWQGGEIFTRPFSGRLDDNGRALVLRYRNIDVTGAAGNRPTGWREWDQEIVLER